MEPWLIILLVVAGLLVVVAIFIYNSLVNKKVETENAWSQIDVQLKRRHDLIPNLVETVKGYATQEKTVLTEVTEARAKASSIQLNANDLTDPAKVQAFQSAQAQLGARLRQPVGGSPGAGKQIGSLNHVAHRKVAFHRTLLPAAL